MGIEYPRTSWLRKSVRVSPSGRRIVHQTVRVYLWELSSLFKSLNRMYIENLVELYFFFFETPANVFLKITPPPPTKPQTNNQKQYMHA